MKNTSYEDINHHQREELRKSSNSFSLISARDMATYEFMKSIEPKIENKIRMTFDPTFVFNKQSFSCDKYAKKKGLDGSHKWVLLHLYKNEPFEYDLISRLKKDGYKVCSLRPSKYADLCLNDIGPLEQAAIYRYFDVIITHRFHDSVFFL